MLLQQACCNSNWFFWKSLLLLRWVWLVPRYQLKVKLISNISVWNAPIAKKAKVFLCNGGGDGDDHPKDDNGKEDGGGDGDDHPKDDDGKEGGGGDGDVQGPFRWWRRPRWLRWCRWDLAEWHEGVDGGGGRLRSNETWIKPPNQNARTLFCMLCCAENLALQHSTMYNMSVYHFSLNCACITFSVYYYLK